MQFICTIIYNHYMYIHLYSHTVLRLFSRLSSFSACRGCVSVTWITGMFGMYGTRTLSHSSGWTAWRKGRPSGTSMTTSMACLWRNSSISRLSRLGQVRSAVVCYRGQVNNRLTRSEQLGRSAVAFLSQVRSPVFGYQGQISSRLSRSRQVSSRFRLSHVSRSVISVVVSCQVSLGLLRSGRGTLLWRNTYY